MVGREREREAVTFFFAPCIVVVCSRPFADTLSDSWLCSLLFVPTTTYKRGGYDECTSLSRVFFFAVDNVFLS